MAPVRVTDASLTSPLLSSPPQYNGRPSLKEELPLHQNLLSKRQMESLAAFCDTLLPSMDPPLSNSSNAEDPDIACFYHTSASMAGILERAGGLLSGGLNHPRIPLIRCALLLLSTWYGSLLLCGRRCISARFPFVRRFALLEQDKREEILLSWALGSIPYLRALYLSLKCITMHLYFTQVNKKKENPSWKAIGYCGPDPSLADQRHDATNNCEDPLQSAFLHMNHSPDLISSQLHQSGFPSPTFSFTDGCTLYCDAVIVGSGSGGSVAAGVLAAAGHKVLVIEKGHYYPASDLSLLEGPTTTAMYEGVGLIATDDMGVLLLAGATVGGGSTINWSASIPTPESIRREWIHECRLDLFGSAAYDHALDVVCRRISVQSRVEEDGFNSAVLRRGCAAAGYDVANVPRNAPPDHYCGWCHLGCKDEKKRSTSVTWLADMAKSGNGFLLPGCLAVKVLKVPGKTRARATGIIAKFAGGFQFTIKSKVTIVAGGALNTPHLLKKSGLRNKHIGENLHLHPVVMAWGYFPETVEWPEKNKRSYEGGILTSMSQAVGKDVLLQTPALHPGMFASLVPWVSAEDFRRRMQRFARTAHIFALLRDKGCGTVNYPGTVKHQVSTEDEQRLKEGLEAAVRIMKAAGAEEFGTQWLGGETGKGNEGVERIVKGVRDRRMGDLRTPMCSAHQMGSCRMGSTAKDGAVGPGGEVWEVEGLFVADTSVFPTALGVNPMVTVQAVAYCIAQGIDEVLRGKEAH